MVSHPAPIAPAPAPAAAEPPVLVLGIGNLLLGDEGVGVHAVQRLAQERLPPGVAVLDGGTGGLHLLSCFTGHDALVVVDATVDGRPAGTVRRLEPRFAADYPPTLVAHDIGLKDLVDAAQVLGARPRVVLVTVSVDSLPAGPEAMSLELSAPVAAALPHALAAVREALAELGEGGLIPPAPSPEGEGEPASARSAADAVSPLSRERGGSPKGGRGEAPRRRVAADVASVRPSADRRVRDEPAEGGHA